MSVKDGWRAGDGVNLCLLATPEPCADGAPNTGRAFRAINLRTCTSWQAPNNLHAACIDPWHVDEKARVQIYSANPILLTPPGTTKQELFAALVGNDQILIRRREYCAECGTFESPLRESDLRLLSAPGHLDLLRRGHRRPAQFRLHLQGRSPHHSAVSATPGLSRPRDALSTSDAL